MAELERLKQELIEAYAQAYQNAFNSYAPTANNEYAYYWRATRDAREQNAATAIEKAVDEIARADLAGFADHLNNKFKAN